VTPSEFREDLSTQKTRMNGLSCGKEIMTIYSAVLIGCQRVTDRRTDVQPISITCFSIADARKNRDKETHSHRLTIGLIGENVMFKAASHFVLICCLFVNCNHNLWCV